VKSLSSKNDTDKQNKSNSNDELENIIAADFSGNEDDIEIEASGPDGADEAHPTAEPGTQEASSSASNEEVETLKKDLLYLKAEFDNFRKRAIKERSDLIKFGPERLAIEVLNVIDIFEMALAQDVTPENLDSFKEGMTMTHNQLASALTKFGIEELSPLGEVFDPNMHEALTSEPTDKYPEGHVSQVFKKGYKFYDKLIRPAQVVVAAPVEQSTEE
tara:strand:- start:176727 stop:177377 length:651 start_codon:yes stop_codon:yes gene_type:complete